MGFIRTKNLISSEPTSFFDHTSQNGLRIPSISARFPSISWILPKSAGSLRLILPAAVVAGMTEAQQVIYVVVPHDGRKPVKERRASNRAIIQNLESIITNPLQKVIMRSCDGFFSIRCVRSQGKLPVTDFVAHGIPHSLSPMRETKERLQSLVLMFTVVCSKWARS